MKTTTNFKKLALLFCFTFSTWMAIAGKVPTVTNTVKAETEKTIKDYFKFPQVLMAHKEMEKIGCRKVEVLFTTSENGTVNFALAKIEDTGMKKEIEKQFLKLKLPKLKHEVVYSVILNFRAM